MNLLKQIRKVIVWGLVIGGALGDSLSMESSDIFFVEIGRKVSRIEKAIVAEERRAAFEWHKQTLEAVKKIDRVLNPSRPERKDVPTGKKDKKDSQFERSFNLAKYAIIAVYSNDGDNNSKDAKGEGQSKDKDKDKDVVHCQNKDQRLTFLSAGILDEKQQLRVTTALQQVSADEDYMVMSKFYYTAEPWSGQMFKKYFVDLFSFESCLDESIIKKMKTEGQELYQAKASDNQKKRETQRAQRKAQQETKDEGKKESDSKAEAIKSDNRMGADLASYDEGQWIGFNIVEFMDYTLLTAGFDDGSNARTRTLVSKAAWGIYPDPLSSYYVGDGRELGLIPPGDGIIGAVVLGELDKRNLRESAYDKPGRQNVLGLTGPLAHKTADKLFENFAHFFYHSEQIIMQYLIYNISVWGIPAYEAVVDKLWAALGKDMKGLSKKTEEGAIREGSEILLNYNWKIMGDNFNPKLIKKMPTSEVWVYIQKEDLYFKVGNREPEKINATNLHSMSLEDLITLKTNVKEKKHPECMKLINDFFREETYLIWKKIQINEKHWDASINYREALDIIGGNEEENQQVITNLQQYMDDLAWINDLEVKECETKNIIRESSAVKFTYEQLQRDEWSALLPTNLDLDTLKDTNTKVELELEICSHRIICPVCAASFFYDLNLREEIGSNLKARIAEAVSTSIVTSYLKQYEGLFEGLVSPGATDFNPVDYAYRVAKLRFEIKSTINQTRKNVDLVKKLLNAAEMRVLVSSCREM